VFRVSNVHGVTILVNTRTETKMSREAEHFEIEFLFDMFYTPRIK